MNEFDFPNPIEAETELEVEDAARARVGDELRGAEASGKVVRGGVVRTAGYVIGTLANVVASIILLRYLGVAQFGSYVAVMSIVSIAGGVSDGGLTAVGNRELALLPSTHERRAMVSRLFGMRLVITPLVVILAVLFTVIAGYPADLVLGTALAGIGWTFVAASSSLAMPLSVDLKIVSLSSLEVIKQVGSTVAIILLVVAGAALTPFFAAAIPGALIAIALTPALAGRGVLGLPSFRFREWGELIKSSLPIALAAVVGVVYLRFLTILMFQFTTDTETGLFGTSARIIEAIGGLPLLAFMVALPVMSLSNEEDRERMRSIFQRMVEVGMVFSWLLVTFLFLGAKPIIEVVGGAEYAGAVPVLQIQSFALVGSLLAMACLMAAIAMDMRRTIIAANTFALVTVVVLGVPTVLLWGAQGAAAATVLGETAMGLGYWYLIGRADALNRPSLMHAWKPMLATGAAIAAAALSGADDAAATAIGLVVFSLIALATRAVPAEVFDAMRNFRS